MEERDRGKRHCLNSPLVRSDLPFASTPAVGTAPPLSSLPKHMETRKEVWSQQPTPVTQQRPAPGIPTATPSFPTAAREGEGITGQISFVSMVYFLRCIISFARLDTAWVSCRHSSACLTLRFANCSTIYCHFWTCYDGTKCFTILFSSSALICYMRPVMMLLRPGAGHRIS